LRVENVFKPILTGDAHAYICQVRRVAGALWQRPQRRSVMRMVLLVIGWVLTIGAFANAALAAYALYIIGAGGFADLGMSVDALLTGHAPFLAWTKGAAAAILPENIAQFFFTAPALMIFPVRAVIAGLLGSWALNGARRRNKITV
jgi:hypothetical protein